MLLPNYNIVFINWNNSNIELLNWSTKLIT